MKKLFLAIAAVATLLASCSKEDGLTGVSKSQVTFTVSSPEMATRYGEGEKATTLYYAVYDAVENATEKGLVRGLSQLKGEGFTGGKKEVTINLVEGRTYDIIFYAQNADGSPYEPDWVERTLEIETPTDLDANQETYDAFYAHVDNLKVGTAAINETVYLRRPFAQLNVLTNDLDKGAAAGIDIAQTSVTVKNIYTKMNLFTDKVDPESEASVTYALSDVLKDDQGKIVSAVVDNTTYHWLTMNYLLVNDKKMVDVEFTMTDSTVADSSKDNKLVRNYSTVPVERNHRTNIYGSIITNPAKFNVEIKPEFLKPDHNVNGGEQYTVTVATADELQKAIDNAKEGRTIITFEQDIDANSTRSSSPATITISQKENVDLVIDGAGYKFDGTFKVHGYSVYRDATLDFVNINFKTSTAGLNFIHAVDFDNSQRYSQNITVSKCTFEAVSGSEAENTAVALQVNATKNLLVLNCTATNMHSFIQATASDNITIDGIKVNGKKNGVSFGTSTNVTVRNSNIEVSGYGIRTANKDTANNVDVTLENNTIKAELPVVARYMNIKGKGSNNAEIEDAKYKDNVSMTFKGTNTLTATNSYGYQVVFTAGDDGTYEMPAAETTINLTGADDYYVYPRDWVDLSQTFTGEITAEGDKPAIYVSAGVDSDDLGTFDADFDDAGPQKGLVVKDATITAETGIECNTDTSIYLENTTFNCDTALKIATSNMTIYAVNCSFNVPEGGKICVNNAATQIIVVGGCKINGVDATQEQFKALLDNVVSVIWLN